MRLQLPFRSALHSLSIRMAEVWETSMSRRFVLLAISAFAGILVLTALMLIRFFDIDVYKSQLEAMASRTLNLDVSFGGGLRLGFVPGPRVTIQDVRVRNGGSDIATAKQVRLSIRLIPLFRGRVQIRNISLAHVEILIERGNNGAFNFERAPMSNEGADPLRLAGVSLSDGTLRYADRQTGQGYVAQGCRVRVRDVRLAGGTASSLMKRLSLDAKGHCDRIPKQDFTVTDVAFAVNGAQGIFVAAPVTMSAFGAHGSGRIHADFSGAVPTYRVEFALPQFQVDQVFKTLSPQDIARGRMSFLVDLSMQGVSMREMRQGAQGEFALSGENVSLLGRDLDEEFSRFESSQNFNLADAGALFFAGPFGLAVTKGYTFASLLQGSDGSTEILKLVSEWKVDRGMAQAQDVAMATRDNRIALHGALDLVNEQFDDVILALIDADGCAKAQQKIQGTFENPMVENPNVLESLAGSAINLYKHGRALLPGGACEVFYAGSVAAPS